MNIYNLKKILEHKENEHIEYKKAEIQFDIKKTLKYCVALANEKGGKFILGVDDNRNIVGSKAFMDIGDIRSKIFDKLNIRVNINEIYDEGKRVLVFDIPTRPIGTPLHYDGAYLMRLGENLVPMSADQLQRIFREGRPVFELQISKYDVASDEVVSLLDTQSYFDLREIPLPKTRDGVIDRFLREQLILKNTNGSYDITNLGAILFAKDMREFEGIGRKAIRMVVYDGNGKTKTKRDIHGNKGYAVGFESLIDYIMGQIPANEVIENALRENIPMYPKLAIRELVANALIHQDFSIDGSSVMIEIYNNRVEITNPGKPIVETDRFIDEYRSRNEKLADLMRRLRICEEKGSGIDKALEAIELYQLPAIGIRESTIRTIITLFSHKPFKEMDKPERVRAGYQHCCLKYVMSEFMSNSSFRERFGLSDTKTSTDVISKVIGHALDEELIKYANPESTSKRYVKYVPYWA
ncbi:MAG: putative DNA binding domain-containing protein [Sulfurovaceae bacterium]|nr:putative DNA binding domain-containing protein [Sulfurovaceae bacterium]